LKLVKRSSKNYINSFWYLFNSYNTTELIFFLYNWNSKCGFGLLLKFNYFNNNLFN